MIQEIPGLSRFIPVYPDLSRFMILEIPGLSRFIPSMFGALSVLGRRIIGKIRTYYKNGTNLGIAFRGLNEANEPFLG
jgi:hypothetical protein